MLLTFTSSHSASMHLTYWFSFGIVLQARSMNETDKWILFSRIKYLSLFASSFQEVVVAYLAPFIIFTWNASSISITTNSFESGPLVNNIKHIACLSGHKQYFKKEFSEYRSLNKVLECIKQNRQMKKQNRYLQLGFRTEVIHGFHWAIWATQCK